MPAIPGVAACRRGYVGTGAAQEVSRPRRLLRSSRPPFMHRGPATAAREPATRQRYIALTPQSHRRAQTSRSLFQGISCRVRCRFFMVITPHGRYSAYRTNGATRTEMQGSQRVRHTGGYGKKRMGERRAIASQFRALPTDVSQEYDPHYRHFAVASTPTRSPEWQPRRSGATGRVWRVRCFGQVRRQPTILRQDGLRCDCPDRDRQARAPERSGQGSLQRGVGRDP